MAKTHTGGTENAAVPFLQEGICGIHETKRDGHVSVTLLADFKLLQEFEISRNNDCFACWCALHVEKWIWIWIWIDSM